MINRTTKAILVAIFTLHFSAPAFAGQALEAVNAEVEQTSAIIDQNYGILLDTQERNALKLDLIARKAALDVCDNGKTVRQATDTAITTFEISDPDDQRTLLIQVQSQAVMLEGTGGGGQDPEYP